MCLYFSPLNLSLGSSGLMQNSHWTQKTSPLVMVNQATDRRVTETGGSTTGDTFMFLIKVLLSPRRDRWRQLRYKLTREISCLPTLVSISLFCYLACPPPLPPPRLCALVSECVRASFSNNIQKKAEALNLLSAENEDCAVNGDPMAHVHKDLMANSLASEAVQQRGGRQNHFNPINNAWGKARFLYWTVLA